MSFICEGCNTTFFIGISYQMPNGKCICDSCLDYLNEESIMTSHDKKPVNFTSGAKDKNDNR